ncbi:amine sulfotransferase-like isoform X2 [Heptranchias perlo]|uniref:amine sulfotransferase-like isoform X2 n=1 Tax=Heptranchias perlo TaxID=212740 RepID=UPI003559831E
MDNKEEEKETSDYFQHNGIPFISPLLSIEHFEWVKDFKMDQDTVFIITYPKSGTTWMQQITSLILANGNIDSVKDKVLYERAPWVEYVVFIPNCKDSQLITSHLNYHMAPNALKNKIGKIIYVARNPKDVTVSFYHYHKFSNFLKKPKDFQHFLEQFVEGNVFYGSWFDHIREWYSHKDELNMMFVTYEDMQKDLRSMIEKVAIFLNKKLDGKTLESIMDHCTFKFMKENPASNYQDALQMFNTDCGSFYRKEVKFVLGDSIEHTEVNQQPILHSAQFSFRELS